MSNFTEMELFIEEHDCISCFYNCIMRHKKATIPNNLGFLLKCLNQKPKKLSLKKKLIISHVLLGFFFNDDGPFIVDTIVGVAVVLPAAIALAFRSRLGWLVLPEVDLDQIRTVE